MHLKKKILKRLIEPVKRPQGVHREVWGLISKDDRDQPQLIPTEEPKIYKHPKARLRYGVRKWHWTPFKNPARTDGAVFYHWRCVNDDPNKDYPFAKFNKQTQIIKYTDAEYAQHLNNDESWTKAETDYLFELCKRYDLRFFIIHDRWDSSLFPSGKNRSIDELKDRYYKCVGIMQKVKHGDDAQIYVFDLEHEQKRREQLEKLFNRTKEQVEEESYLIEELKKIEIRKKERERKQQDVNKLLTAVVEIENSKQQQLQQQQQQQQLNKQKYTNENRAQNGMSNQQQLNSSLNASTSSSNLSKRIKQRKFSTQSNTNQNVSGNSGNTSLNNSADLNNVVISPSAQAQSNTPADTKDSKNKKSIIFKATVESAGIKFPDNKLAGVTLRSYKKKLPQSVGTKKAKAIETLLEELNIDHRTVATEEVCEQFNELRSDIVLLYEIHQALTNCEYECQTLRHRYESIAPGKSAELNTLESSLSSSTSSLFSSLASSATPQKRISEIFESSLTPTGSLERRRKAALNQTNILKRLRGRNAT